MIQVKITFSNEIKDNKEVTTYIVRQLVNDLWKGVKQFYNYEDAVIFAQQLRRELKNEQ